MPSVFDEIVSTSEPQATAIRTGEGRLAPGQTRDNPGQVSDQSTQVDPLFDGNGDEGERKRKVKWPAMADEKVQREFDEDLHMLLEISLKGSSKRKLELIGVTIYEAGKDRFGLIEPKKVKPTHTPSRRQKEISSWKRELRSLLRQRWIRANEEEKPGLSDLREQLRSKLTSLRRAEAQRNKIKAREKSRRSFFNNPYQFTKKLFEQSKSGQLVISQQNPEDHLASTYSDLKQGTPLPDIAGLIKHIEPGVKFDRAKPRLGEVERFIKKARSCSAPGPN